MNQRKPESNNNALIFTLVGGLALGVFVVLNFLSFGIFAWPVIITLIIAGIGGLHYMLWGHDLSQEVSDEREAFLRQQTREREQDEGWNA